MYLENPDCKMQELKISRHATYFKRNVFANGITPSLLPNLTKATIKFHTKPNVFNYMEYSENNSPHFVYS